MAYCKKCGAYIPDGLTACLACGFDENMAGGENRDTAVKSANDRIKEELEEQRRVRQEENRRWAEQEQQRRQQQDQSRLWAEQEQQRRQQQDQSRRWAEQEQQRRQQQQQSRQWAQEEYARRQADRVNAARNYTYRTTMNRAGSGQSAESNKLFAALSYLSFLFVLPYIFTPQDDFAKYHARQGLKLFIFTIISDTIGALTGFGWILTLLRFYYIYKGMSNAFNNVKEPLPYIGSIGE